MKKIASYVIIFVISFILGAVAYLVSDHLKNKPSEPIPVTDNSEPTVVNRNEVLETEVVEEVPVTETVEEVSDTETVEEVPVTEVVEETPPTEVIEDVPTTEIIEEEPVNTEIVEEPETTEEEYDEEADEGTGGDWEPEGGNIYDFVDAETAAKIEAVTTPEFIATINTILYEGCIDEPVTFYSFENNTLTLLGEKYAYSYGVSEDGAAFCSQLIMSEFEKRMN